MPSNKQEHNKQEPSRLELYKAGKLEERRSERDHLAPLKKVENVIAEEEQQSFRLSPTAIVIALMVILLLVLSVTGL